MVDNKQGLYSSMDDGGRESLREIWRRHIEQWVNVPILE